MNKPSHSLLGGLQELELLTLLAKHFHIQVTRTLYPVFVDFDCQRSDQPQAALQIRKDSDDMGSTFELLVKPLEHIGALEMLVVLSGQPVKGKGFLNVLFDPRTKVWGIFGQRSSQAVRSLRASAGSRRS